MTIWEGEIEQGDTYRYFESKTGHQFIADATDLSQIGSSEYDFVLSSNCLEHVANPLRAIAEWKRVTKPGGALVLVLPYKRSNFDHQRPDTHFEHVLQDYEQNVGEDDLTHLDEILSLHDLSMDPPAGDKAQFKERSLLNHENRTLHHHVFDKKLIEEMLVYSGYEVLDLRRTHTDFVALAKRQT